MAKRNTVKITESKLREMVIEAVKSALNEGVLDNVGQRVRNFKDKASDKIHDFHQGFKTKEGNPQSIEDIFEGDGYNVVRTYNENNATYYEVTRNTGSLGEFFGPEKEDMAEEMNIFLNGNGRATYVGHHPKRTHIEVFKIVF